MDASSITKITLPPYNSNCIPTGQVVVAEDYYVKSARLGDADILDAGVEFKNSVTGQLDVFMSSNGGEVEGVVLNSDDQPAKAATVELNRPVRPLPYQGRRAGRLQTVRMGRHHRWPVRSRIHEVI